MKWLSKYYLAQKHGSSSPFPVAIAMYAVLPHVGVAELLWLGLGALLGTHARADTSVLFTKSSPLCLLHETPFLALRNGTTAVC